MAGSSAWSSPLLPYSRSSLRRERTALVGSSCSQFAASESRNVRIHEHQHPGEGVLRSQGGQPGQHAADVRGALPEDTGWNAARRRRLWPTCRGPHRRPRPRGLQDRRRACPGLCASSSGRPPPRFPYPGRPPPPPRVRLQQLHGQVDAADREVGREELLQLAHSSCRRPWHCLRLPSARTNSRESPLPQPEAASCLHRGRYAHVLLGEENVTCCCISSLPWSGTWRVVVQGTLYSLKCHISHEVNNLHEGLKHYERIPGNAGKRRSVHSIASQEYLNEGVIVLTGFRSVFELSDEY